MSVEHDGTIHFDPRLGPVPLKNNLLFKNLKQYFPEKLDFFRLMKKTIGTMMISEFFYVELQFAIFTF